MEIQLVLPKNRSTNESGLLSLGHLVRITANMRHSFHGISECNEFEVSMIDSLPMLKNFYGITDDFNWDLMYSRSENQHVVMISLSHYVDSSLCKPSHSFVVH